MKKWTIEYWHELNNKNSVEYWLKQLDDLQLECVTEEINLLKLYGNSLKMPHSKPLGKGLFELRERKYGFRIYYCFLPKQTIFLLMAGDKASQNRDINKALKRLSQLK